MGISFSLSSFWELLVSRWPELVTELFRHINMTTLALLISLAIGVPLGILMARKKDRLVDKIGTLYIVFIIAVPSLAYIFLFKAIGGSFGLPTTFDMESPSRLMYILPIVSLALPSIAI